MEIIYTHLRGLAECRSRFGLIYTIKYFNKKDLLVQVSLKKKFK